MNICRFEYQGAVRIGLVTDDALLDLTPFGISQLTPLLDHDDPVAHVTALVGQHVPRLSLSDVRLLAPVERQEIWAAGVTYLRSKSARMEGSDFSASAYDKVYAAERPEIFFKSLPEKVVAPGEPVGIRSDATSERPGTGTGSGDELARPDRGFTPLATT